MTEDKWLASSQPEAMLDYLLQRTPPARWRFLLSPYRSAARESRPLTSRRKVRLFAVACCRRVWSLLQDVRSRNAVEAATSFADGLLTEETLGTIQAEARNAEAQARTVLWDYGDFLDGAHLSTRKSVFLAARAAVNLASSDIAGVLAAVKDVWQAGLEAALESRDPRTWAAIIGSEVQTNKLRDIVGNPFQPRVFERSILAWNGGIIPKIAEGIYAEGAFDRMPILHDALLDAGCTDEAILMHCRNPEGHVLGCWALDSILGKS
jgi:hypothetical protein